VASFDITSNGGAEAQMLDVLGYTLAKPEPASGVLVGAGLTLIVSIARRRRLAIQRNQRRIGPKLILIASS